MTNPLQVAQVTRDTPLREALGHLDRASLQILLVTDDRRHLVGVVTDGDVRRALLRGVDLSIPVEAVMNSKPRTVREGCTRSRARSVMRRYSIRQIPVVNEAGEVVDLLMWEDPVTATPETHDESVVIMAGGLGTRLDPFTKILPKAMIPVGDKPIIEMIMERFSSQGFRRFIISVGYKAEIIQAYFGSGEERPYTVEYVMEDKPLGTAGALSMLPNRVTGPLIVTNCDVILEIDLGELLRFHKKRGVALTIVGSLKDFVVPYGVLRADHAGVKIEEKPRFDFLVNTGMYVLDERVLGLCPAQKTMDMTDLVSAVRAAGLRVDSYRYHGPWFDIGQWDAYEHTLRKLREMD